MYSTSDLAPDIFVDPQWKATNFDIALNDAGVYGAIGTMRFFGPESPYPSLIWSGFLLGLLLPFIPWM
jgi:hypothetical protein